MKAIVDRIENGYAILLLGDEEIRLDLPQEYLPPDVGEGAILQLTFAVDEGQTEETLQRMRERIQRLRNQPSR